MIELHGLTKSYGSKLAVHDLSFTVRPGMVTGFLGPNGAGKSTTMRMILGLDKPTSGTVTVNGKRYADHPAPLGEVGGLLEARAVHTGRSARNHLRGLAATHGISTRRVDDVIELVGLRQVAKKRSGGFSLGMGQRLGIATALLGDPATVVLDEPVNGLDPEGIRWVRELLTHLAAEGRTVFLSSHLMSEMALTAQHVVVIGKGRLIADTTIAELVKSASGGAVLVRSPQASHLAAALSQAGGSVSNSAVSNSTVSNSSVSNSSGALLVSGLSAAQIGDIAHQAGAVIHELTPQQASLEEAFMDMTSDAVEFNAGLPR